MFLHPRAGNVARAVELAIHGGAPIGGSIQFAVEPLGAADMANVLVLVREDFPDGELTPERFVAAVRARPELWTADRIELLISALEREADATVRAGDWTALTNGQG